MCEGRENRGKDSCQKVKKRKRVPQSAGTREVEFSILDTETRRQLHPFHPSFYPLNLLHIKRY